VCREESSRRGHVGRIFVLKRYGDAVMTAMQAVLSPEKGKFRNFFKNKIFLNTSFAWGVFVGIHLERWLFGLDREGFLFLFYELGARQ